MDATVNAVLDIANLQLEFRTPQSTVRALKGVSVRVNPGEIVGIVGESGSGKSVTAMSSLKLLPQGKAFVTGGTINILGHDVLAADDAKMRALRGGDASMIFQEPMTALNPVKRIRDQILEVVARHQALDDAQALDLARRLIQDMHIPDPDRILNSYPHELSGGLRQRVLIAMAFSSDPKLIIADEPTTALDVTVQAQILSLLKEKAQERGSAVVLISHDLAVIAQLCHRVYVMYKGEIVESGTTREVISTPKHVYTKALLNALPEGKPRKSRLETVAAAMLEGDEPAKAEQSVQPAEQHSTLPAPSGQVLLELEQARLLYPTDFDFAGRPVGHHAAVDGVDLSIFEGETLAVVGESGSGKTSIAKLIVGLAPLSSGTLAFQGQKLGPKRSLGNRRDIQMVFQDPQSSLNPRHRVWQLVTEPLTVGARPSRKEREDKAAELMELVGLETDQIHRFAHEFSGGQRQRIAIARALAVHPKLLVLDEPTSALDVSVQAQILNLLLDLQRDQGLTYLFISHDVSVVRHISDRVAVMYQGRIVERGPVEEVLESPKETYTKNLMAAVPSLERAFA